MGCMQKRANIRVLTIYRWKTSLQKIGPQLASENFNFRVILAIPGIL